MSVSLYAETSAKMEHQQMLRLEVTVTAVTRPLRDSVNVITTDRVTVITSSHKAR